MLIGDIIPYGRNARHNDKAIPKVAESIRKFGLRGSIVLESRDNPVIVCGHTRVAAMKSLGWTEIPDEHIEYCDGLTQDEIDAFRLMEHAGKHRAQLLQVGQRQQARRVRQPNPKQGHLDQTHQLLRQGERGAGIQEREIHHHQHLHQIRQPIHLRLRKGELDMTTKNTAKKTSADEWWKPPVQRTRSRAEMAARANEDSRAFIKVNAKALGLDKKKSGK